jgi:uncharacterized pyridoxamine 5'-phosphate oxidase family protein
VRETAEDLAALQALLDRSYEAAGEHLRSIHTPERRMPAERIAERLQGVTLLVLATVTAAGRPITGAVDGIFYRGEFYLGSSAESVRFRHMRSRPAVSATHLPGEELAVTVHGRAAMVDLDAAEHAEFRETLLGVYLPRFGDAYLRLIEEGAAFARIEAERMFTFHMPSDHSAN